MLDVRCSLFPSMQQTSKDLVVIYRRRFAQSATYRWRVWSVLTRHFFSRWISPQAAVLDLGCGYGEFINQIPAARKLAMDLNTDVAQYLNKDVELHCQDCSSEWQLEPDTLDVVFTSNFLEHLPSKAHVLRTLKEAYRCLKPGGLLIAMGPNIRLIPGTYWDFFDHQVILTEASLGEALEICGFTLQHVKDRFLPYTIVNVRRYPLCLVRLYLALPFVWRLFGKQFLLVAQKPRPDDGRRPAHPHEVIRTDPVRR
jgi:SAM-dependent methyltransferase